MSWFQPKPRNEAISEIDRRVSRATPYQSVTIHIGHIRSMCRDEGEICDALRHADSAGVQVIGPMNYAEYNDFMRNSGLNIR